MRRKLSRALALSQQERWNLLQAWGLLLLVDLGLRALTFRRVQEWLGRGQNDSATAPPDAIERLAWVVNAAARNHLYGMSCLRRSLVLQWLLARRGIAAELRFGVRKPDTGTLDAHAWVEVEGQPIGKPQAGTAHFASLAAMEAQP